MFNLKKFNEFNFIPLMETSYLIHLKEGDILDNAQYMALSFLDSSKIKLEQDSQLKLPTLAKGTLNKFFVEGKGILLGRTAGMYGDVEYYLCGVPRIFLPDGKMINTSKELEKYLKNDNDKNSQLFHYDTKAYIKPFNNWDDNRYYGIFYSLKDAIKIVMENDFVKVDEITS